MPPRHCYHRSKGGPILPDMSAEGVPPPSWRSSHARAFLHRYLLSLQVCAHVSNDQGALHRVVGGLSITSLLFQESQHVSSAGHHFRLARVQGDLRWGRPCLPCLRSRAVI